MATVLVVDDSANNRALMSAVLQRGDHRVLEAVNGAEALGLARLRRPDVVITDVLMPKVDGYELERELQRDPATASIPLIVHTAAYDDREVNAMVQQSPRVRVLPKPAAVSDVLEAVSTLVSAALPAPVEQPDDGRADHLAALNDKLLQNVRELEALERDRQDLIEHLLHAQENERAAIAGDIHDDSVQAMTAVAMRLELLGRDLDDPRLVQRHTELQLTVRAAIGRLRRLLFQLHPPALETEGLAAAVASYIDHTAGDGRPHTDVVDTLAYEPPVPLRILLYRVVQEALVNVAKHADAQQVRVELSGGGGGFTVAVRDDGRGFEPDEATSRPGHLGLVAMRQRVELAGGRWRVESTPGAGTTIHAWVPAALGLLAS